MKEIRLSIAVMTHPKRMSWWDSILEGIGSFPAQPKMQVDWKSEGIWINHRRALESFDPDSTHHLVLQDDLTYCRDFQAGVYKLLGAAPEGVPVSLFCANHHLVEQARGKGVSWVSQVGPLWAQAWIWPTTMIGPMLEWIDTKVVSVDQMKWDDVRVSMYLTEHKIPMWMTVPSLVEHDGFDRSLMGIQAAPFGRKRVASWWIGLETSPLDIDWSKGVVEGSKKALFHEHNTMGSNRKYLVQHG